MHRLSISVLIWSLAVLTAQAADRKFPYDATIDVAEEFARSGPGQKFYPTSKLKRGERVTVQRHDPGGWVMIVPPAGSFSWIQADYVRVKKGSAGVVKENNVIVRLGSQFNDERDWYQCELNTGDSVEILGEKTFETDRGPVKMYKIKPPPNEYRWILGRAIIPADSPVRQPMKQGEIAEAVPPKIKSPVETNGTDPFADGPNPTSEIADKPMRRERDQAKTPVESIRHTGPDTGELEQMRSQLAAVDDEFRAMIKDEPSTWNVVSIEQQYRQLQDVSELPAFQTQIKLRLDAVERYAKIKQEYDEFMRVTAETKLRDAQLMSLTNQPPGQPQASPSTPEPSPPTPPPGRPAPAAPKSFDGAGIIQRAATNGRVAPAYTLVAPNGKFLAYLQAAPGIDLNAYVGQSMGVIGQRSFRQELQAEIIIVRSLTPVRLRGP